MRLGKLLTGHPFPAALSAGRRFSVASAGVNFRLTGEQRALQELARNFGRSHITPVSAALDKSGAYPTAIFKAAFELGLVNLHIPPSYGGLGLGNLEGAIVSEELGYADAGVMTALSINGIAAFPLIFAGSESLKRKYLGRLTAAPTHAAYCVTEPGCGSDVAGLQTRAVRDGDAFRITGSKAWITNAGVADWLFLLARTGAATDPAGKAFTGFIVEADTPGITLGPKEDMLGQRCSDTRGMSFEDVLVPASNVVGAVGTGFGLAMKVFDYTRPGVAAGALGIARRALDASVEYAAQRKTMGKPIAQHQAVAFKLADMAVGIEAARLLVYESASLLDRGAPSGQVAAMAKLFASEHCQRCVAEAVQIHGGLGFSNACIASRLYRDARITTIYEGASEIQRLIISRSLLLAQQ